MTWTAYTPPFGDTVGIADIEVLNENVIWAVGVKFDVNDSLYNFFGPSPVLMARTVDGGANWSVTQVPVGDLPFIANMSVIDENTAFISGLDQFGNAKTLKTTDGSQTWTLSPVDWDPVVSWPDYLHAFSPAKACVVGDPRDGEFEIYTTSNGGLFWERVSGGDIPDPLPGEFGFNNTGDVLGNTIWFGTSAGRIFRSQNAGLTWLVAQTPLSAVNAISFSDADNGLVSAFDLHTSIIAHTADGGTNWTNITPLDGEFRLLGIEYISNSPFILMGITKNSILSGPFETWLSPDRGITWQQISSGEIIGWPTFLDGDTGWAGEFQQLDHPTRLYKYTGSPLVGLFSANPLQAEVIVSPNPAGDVFQVQVKAEKPADFLLLLNDLQGRLVRQQTVNGQSDFTTYFHVADLPAGQYVLTVANAESRIALAVVKQ
ncbi:MAG TPA: T9SS type A sorting domain-containing protein [Saprospiraceae bacterium]|nr:T9SS type A sorting domain-containing protein [Saprospiraceae bacterium]